MYVWLCVMLRAAGPSDDGDPAGGGASEGKGGLSATLAAFHYGASGRADADAARRQQREEQRRRRERKSGRKSEEEDRDSDDDATSAAGEAGAVPSLSRHVLFIDAISDSQVAAMLGGKYAAHATRELQRRADAAADDATTV